MTDATGRRSSAALAWARYFVAIALVGAIGAGFAIVFRAALRGVLRALYHRDDVVTAIASLPWHTRLLAPAAGGLLAGALGVVAAKRAGGHGVAEILEAVALGRGQPSMPTALIKGAGSFAAIVTGGSIGREGPIVQFGSGAGALVGHRLGVAPARIRALVAAGTAAGFAAAYDTPIAAVLFVLEIVTGFLALEVLLPVLGAASLATYLTRLVLGESPLYGLRAFRVASAGELAVYALVGVLAGLVGALFMAALDRGERVAARVKLPRPVRGAAGGLLVGAIAIALPAVCGNGAEAIGQILDARVGVAMLAVLLAAKLVATVCSVASGSPGGVFTPSLFLGAALGGLVGAAAHRVAPWIVAGPLPGGYALVGMAALAAATTHAPLMAAALVFEFSGDASLLPPLMVASALATFVARRLRPESIYTEELRRRGIAWRGNLAQRLARAVSARDLMRLDPPAVAPDAPLDAALTLLERGARAVYVVRGAEVRAIDVSAAKSVWAARARGEASAASAASAWDVARAVPVAVADDSLLVLNEKLWNIEWGEIPVVAPDAPPRLLGAVTRRDVLGAFDREILQRDVLLTRVVWFEGQREAADFLELPAGQRVELVAAPAWLAGRALDLAEVFRDYGVMVLAVRPGNTGAHAALRDPAPGYRPADGDRLLLKGLPASIEAFRSGRHSGTDPAAMGREG